MIRSLATRLATFAAGSLFSLAAAATDVTGAGSSFVYPVLSNWSARFAEVTGHRVNYQSIGSGGGIAQIKAGTVDFGASDKPLSSAELDRHGLGQFPLVIGGIVPVFNIEGIEAGTLVLDGDVLADIFLGKVTRWNDPAIEALNGDLALPDAKITVVHRSDGSGTSFNFTNYLSKVSSAWKDTVGEGTSVQWPVGVGGKGNEGVAAYVKQIRNSIGYVEYAYALKNDIGYALLKNAAGTTVQPNRESFQVAAASADWTAAKDFNLIMTDAPGEDAWPIAATVWAILYKQPKNAENAKVAFEFFEWALENGQAQAESLDYVPLPSALVEQVEAYWSAEFTL